MERRIVSANALKCPLEMRFILCCKIYQACGQSYWQRQDRSKMDEGEAFPVYLLTTLRNPPVLVGGTVNPMKPPCREKFWIAVGLCRNRSAYFKPHISCCGRSAPSWFRHLEFDTRCETSLAYRNVPSPNEVRDNDADRGSRGHNWQRVAPAESCP